MAMLDGQHKVGVLSVQFHRAGCCVDRHAAPLLQPGVGAAGSPAAQLLLLSGGADHAVCLWDVMRSACLQRLPCHAAPVTAIRAVGQVIVTIAGVRSEA